MDPARPFVVAAPAHPSLDDAIVRFGDTLRAETRWFGRRGADAPKPLPSLIRRLVAEDPGVRLAAVVDGEIIGLARIDDGHQQLRPVGRAAVEPWRRRGVALALAQAIVARAHALGIERIVVRTSHRGAELRELGAALGFQVVDLGRGRVDLIRTLRPDARSA